VTTLKFPHTPRWPRRESAGYSASGVSCSARHAALVATCSALAMTRAAPTTIRTALAVYNTTWRWWQRASGAAQFVAYTVLVTARKRRLQREWRRLQRATRRAGRDTCCAGHDARRAHHDTHRAGCVQHDVALVEAREWRRSNFRTRRAGHGAKAPATARVASAAVRDTPRRPQREWRRLRRATRSASAGYCASGSGCITIGVGSARRGDECGTKHI
jgi:hypothetical protein